MTQGDGVNGVNGKELEEHITNTIRHAWNDIASKDSTSNGSTSVDLFQATPWLKGIDRENNRIRKALDQQLYNLTQLDSLVRLKLAPKDHHFFRGEKRG